MINTETGYSDLLIQLSKADHDLVDGLFQEALQRYLECFTKFSIIYPRYFRGTASVLLRLEISYLLLKSKDKIKRYLEQHITI